VRDNYTESAAIKDTGDEEWVFGRYADDGGNTSVKSCYAQLTYEESVSGAFRIEISGRPYWLCRDQKLSAPYR
jgi:hypothetical protein